MGTTKMSSTKVNVINNNMIWRLALRIDALVSNEANTAFNSLAARHAAVKPNHPRSAGRHSYQLCSASCLPLRLSFANIPDDYARRSTKEPRGHDATLNLLQD
jgi:hypothetical protein